MKAALLSWLSNLDVSDILLNSILGLAAMVVVVSAWRFHRDKERYGSFNLFSLITHADGTLSRPAVQEFGVFILMSWGFVLLVNKGTLPEWYAMSYLAAFVARAAHSAWLNSKNGNGEKKQQGKIESQGVV